MVVSKVKINKLINEYDLNELENHIIYFYVDKFNLDYKKNKILKDYFSKITISNDLLFKIESLQISNIKELENYLELMIPINDRKFNGAFFTPDYIVDYIIKEIEPKEDHLNLDPSCGCGAFLIGLTD